MAAPTCGLVVIKRFTYRGDTNEEYSNRYLLTGSTPANATDWRTLFDAMVTEEKTVYQTDCKVVGGYGYDSADPEATAVWSVDLTVSPNVIVAGTLAAGGAKLPGDCAVWVRWGLDRLTSKGKRIYLRKYFHPAISAGAGTEDQVWSSQKTALTAFGGKLRDGTFIDGRKITDHLGSALVGAAVSDYTTTRTLKRRGKRPPT